MTPRRSDNLARAAAPGSIDVVTDPLNNGLSVRRFGPTRPAEVLAIHGLTGHGQRWMTLADRYLPGIAVAAPDLIGHGRSTWVAPWTIDHNVAALTALLDSDGGHPVVVGHSFGGAVALNLAAARPDLVAALVLLDPAIGLDGDRMRQVADAMYESPDYTDRAEARAEKADGTWAEVDPSELDRELDEHLVTLPSGRCGWRISIPAMLSYWSELARPIVWPPKGIPTTLIRATKVDPPYAGDELVGGLADRLGSDFTLLEWDCDHMVAQARPADTAAVIRDQLS